MYEVTRQLSGENKAQTWAVWLSHPRASLLPESPGMTVVFGGFDAEEEMPHAAEATAELLKTKDTEVHTSSSHWTVRKSGQLPFAFLLISIHPFHLQMKFSPICGEILPISFYPLNTRICLF